MTEQTADFKQAARDVIDRYLDALFQGRVADVIALYDDDAEIIRYEGVARDQAIRPFVEELTESRRDGQLLSIDRLAAGPDTIAWDATIETERGPIQTSDVFVLSDSGTILRHVPTLRGYWGM
jgi:hypothetical protein